MRKLLLIGMCLAAPSVSSIAQTRSARIRAAIHLPHISVQFKIEFDAPGRRFGGTSVIQPDAAVRISELQKSLRRSPTDAAIYVDIAQSYPNQAPGSASKIADAYSSAISMFRKQLQLRPRDGWVMAQLGEALWRANSADEGEKWLRQAVREAPNDWRCWANLGDYIQTSSLAKVLGNDPGNNRLTAAEIADIGGAQLLLDSFAQRAGIDKAVLEFTASQKEARDAYEKAVMLAPSVAGPYERRFAFRFTDYLVAQNILRIARHEEPVYSQVVPEGVMNDEWTAAELSPEDARLQYDCLAFEIRNYTDKLSTDKTNDLSAGLAKLPPDRQDKFKRGLTRLLKCADGLDHPKSASILLALASIYFLLSDIDDASRAVTRSASLDPNNQQTAQAVVATYLAGKRYKELAMMLQDQIKHQDSAYKRLCLAHVFGDLGNPDGVREQILTGLQLYPQDLLLNLALADGLMKATDPESLKKAGEVLSNAQTLFEKLPIQEQNANQSNLDVTRGMYLALIGKTDVSRLALLRVLSSDPENQEAKEALGAIGVE